MSNPLSCVFMMFCRGCLQILSPDVAMHASLEGVRRNEETILSWVLLLESKDHVVFGE